MNNDQKELAIEALVDEVVALYHLLRAIVPGVHPDIGLTAAKRGILRGLDRLGPQTVPQMARVRLVSRQYIQTIVNQLSEEGFVELVPNPAHKRSGLVQLTPQGKELAYAMAQKERIFLSRLQADLGEEELRFATSVLQKLRDCFGRIHWNGAFEKNPK